MIRNDKNAVRDKLLQGPQRAGGMSVSFDPSVSPATRKAFMQQPVRPTAQIDRFAARQQATPAAQSVESAAPGLYTKENSPGMGWKTRLSLNERLLQGSQQRQQNESAEKIARMNNQNQLDNTKLAGQNQIANTTLANQGEIGVAGVNNAGAMERQTAGDQSAERIEGMRQEGETSRLTQQGTLDTMKDNRKLASDLLLAGRGGQPVEDLYNNQGTPGYVPDVAAIEPPPQKYEQPQAGTYKNIDVTDGSSDTARTMLLDTRTGQMAPPPAPIQTQTGTDTGEGAEYAPDQKEVDYWNSRLGAATTPEERRGALANLKDINPRLFQYLYDEQRRNAQQ